MVYINIIFPFSHLVIFGGKPEICDSPDSFQENLITSGGLRFKQRFFFQMETILIIFEKVV